jgi:hypothetical protein
MNDCEIELVRRSASAVTWSVKKNGLSWCRFDGHQDWVFHEAGAGFQPAIANEGIWGTNPRLNPAFPTGRFLTASGENQTLRSSQKGAAP